MPTSNPQMLVNIGNEIIKRNPNSFLDLGIGFGKYGEGFVRFALTKPVEIIKEALKRIEKIL